eukprot:GHVU01102763.1.p1 GENE.GHVU01102763.1~~GHVU01102763.1.p1  ORF type:complete len:171 (-),score=30.35 GHVU01102763.1:94-606(-)
METLLHATDKNYGARVKVKQFETSARHDFGESNMFRSDRGVHHSFAFAHPTSSTPSLTPSLTHSLLLSIPHFLPLSLIHSLPPSLFHPPTPSSSSSMSVDCVPPPPADEMFLPDPLRFQSQVFASYKSAGAGVVRDVADEELGVVVGLKGYQAALLRDFAGNGAQFDGES